HALAKEVADGVTPADPDALLERLDKVWGQLAFEARWQSPQQREEARRAVIRFLTWHAANRGRTMLTTEHWFDVMVDLPSRGDPVQVRLTGQMDRVEQDSEGKAWIVDFKTGKNPPTRTEIDRHVQLGVYQIASRAGALDGLSTESGGAAIGGAELVHLRKDEPRNTGHPKVQPQAPIELAGDGAPNWVQEALLQANGLVRAEQFPARLCRHCGWCEFRGSCPAQPEGRQVIE
ncbi:MAG TPA: PD-(D/E)XK nuclease family protein, partial [Actinomycetes bacterium]